MKLVSKIALNGDERKFLNAFITLLDTVCNNSDNCSTCPIFEACEGNDLPQILDRLLSQCEDCN